jgi:natural product biosynthesis luciferase-like monooxygenase protein
MKFSLFFFSAEEGSDTTPKYRLVIEGAKFADRNGFSAVWTPERHFHAFGAIYPNPSLMASALAMVTERIQLRSGSLVLPLHSPVRVAEEWSVADNLSNGRVAISCASGWNADDFVLAPRNYQDRGAIMYESIETLQKLWAGETVKVRGVEDREVAVKIFPRPIQSHLPIWITSAGNPETWRKAGEIGANVLTHLVRQDHSGLAKKISLYREARSQHGHDPETGQVSVMIHTFVGDEAATVRELVRIPFMNYLKTSSDIFAVPGKGKIAAVTRTPEEIQALLATAFDMYYETNTLFGTPEICLKMVNRMKEIDVDELACLIDFGVAEDAVLDSLPRLVRLIELSERGAP